MYERSYMHREALSHILVSPKFDFIFTASVDGHLKFWRKAVTGIEFVKTFRVNMAAITSMCLSPNEQRLATSCSAEQSIKVFDVLNFDLMNMIKVSFVPTHITFVNK
jgi:peptidylprolyl isomerase domain and WD repeat-containing protein 1